MTTAVRTPPNHDTLTCYSDYQCRLPACVARARAYEKRRRDAKAAGTWQPFIDAKPVREHLLALHAVGVTVHRVAALTGLSDNVVRGFTQATRAGQRINGRRSRTTPEVAQKILAIDPAEAAPAKVLAIGSLRRLQALAALGWPAQEVSRRTGISGQTVYNIGRQPFILASTAARVAAAYEQLRGKRPSRHTVSAQQISTARNRAASHRWPPPKYWDEVGAIDDPDFEPQYGISAAEVIAQEAHWLMTAGGLSMDQAADRLGKSRSYIDKSLRDYPQGGSAAA